jgi:hypothetical protein
VLGSRFHQRDILVENAEAAEHHQRQDIIGELVQREDHWPCRL